MQYDTQFMRDNMMGPNAVSLLDELIEKQNLTAGMRLLDLGCGRGLTSIRLAEKTKAQVFAFDLWLDQNENYARFCERGFENIIPVHGDATEKSPLPDAFFDALVSVDSYHYYGRDSAFTDDRLARFLKKDAVAMLAFPGLKQDYPDGNYPPEMLLSWTKEDLETMKSVAWWKNLFLQSEKTELLDIREMKIFQSAWDEWLECDNEYAVKDRKSMNAGAGKYMNFIAVYLRKK